MSTATKNSTFLDVLTGSSLTPEQFLEQTKNDTPDEVGYKKVKLIAKFLNGDWKADHSDDDQVKFEPIFYWNAEEKAFVFNYVGSWGSFSGVGSRLCYKSRKDAKTAATVFIAEYREFLS